MRVRSPPRAPSTWCYSVLIIAVTRDDLMAAALDRFGRLDASVSNAAMSPVYRGQPRHRHRGPLRQDPGRQPQRLPFRLGVLAGHVHGRPRRWGQSSTSAPPARSWRVSTNSRTACAKAGLNVLTIGLAEAFRAEGARQRDTAGPVPHRLEQGWAPTTSIPRSFRLAESATRAKLRRSPSTWRRRRRASRPARSSAATVALLAKV